MMIGAAGRNQLPDVGGGGHFTTAPATAASRPWEGMLVAYLFLRC